MRTLLAPLILIALALLQPSALADQDLALGPVHVATVNAGTADCADQGASSRAAEAELQPDANHRVGVDAYNSCSRYSFPGYDQQTRSLSVMAGYCAYNGCSNVAYQWFWMWTESGSQTFGQCYQTLFISGPVFYLPCPTPDGSGPPLLPELP